MKEIVIERFRDTFGRAPDVVVRAPGRVNLLGEHVDYNDGWVLPAAIDRAVWLAAAANDEAVASLHALDLQQHAHINLAHLDDIRLAEQPDEQSWLRYPAGVAWTLQAAGYPITGMDAVFASDVPIGSGVSSSAAVEVAFILAWESLSGFTLDGLQRARLGQRVENDYLGVQSGIMDQFASVHGAPGHLIRLDCRTLDYELISMPAGATILVAGSGVERELANSDYNLRRQECEEAVALLQRFLPHVRSLRDVSIEEFDLVAHRLPVVLRRRAQHVVEECARVLGGVEALRQGQLAAFGRYLRQSHVSLRDLYEVSIPELDLLAATAWQVPACYGARLMGAGFGGAAIMLVNEAAADEVIHSVSQAFAAEYGREPVIFACQVSAGGGVV
jgi:galactokinase